ncbi:MAG: GAF domain-containing protein [Gemmatimonadota bacterium]
MKTLATITALYEAIRRIGLSDDLDQLLDEVLEQAQELIGFDHCALMLYDPERELLGVKRVRGYGERASEVCRIELRRGEGLSGWAVEHGTAVRVNDVSRDPRYVAGLRAAKSNLAVPLIVAHEVAGVINVESDRRNAFTQEHEKLLTVLGSQVALAILAARARERLQRRIRELNALYRISQLAAAQDRLEDTLSAILAVTEELVPEGQVAILLQDDTNRCLRVAQARGYEEGVELLRIPFGQGVTGRCAEEGTVQLVNDVRSNADYIPGVAGARSEIALPLKVEGRVIGVLNAESLTPDAYEEDHVRALGVIAQQAAIVIRSAQLNEEARRLAITDPLTGLHNRRHFVQALDDHLRRARRYRSRMALLMIDADCLKATNDTHGHLVGDRALQQVAGVLRGAFRDTDEVSRIGGDEFAALLLEADGERGEAIGRRIQEAVRTIDLRDEEGRAVRVTVSIGIALFPECGTEGRDLLREADRALYEAKRAGRDALVVADVSPPTAEAAASPA